MADRKELKSIFERAVAAVRQRPAAGQETYVTEITALPGLAVEAREKHWRVVADMPKVLGGEGVEPTPGFYARAALGTCIGADLKFEAALRDIDLRGFEIRIEADSDARGELGLDPALLGYSEVRCSIIVDCDASDAEIDGLLAGIDARSTVTGIYVSETPVQTEIKRK